MRKKNLAILCAIVLILSLLTGCGGSGAAMDNFMSGSMESTTAGGAFNGNLKAEADMNYAPSMPTEKPKEPVRDTVTDTASGTVVEQKLIYTAHLNMETTAFEEAVVALEKLVADYGGYFSNNNVYSYRSGYRNADYTVRIPAENFHVFLDQAGALCNVLSRSSTADDISEQYYDIAGRLTTQQTKLARLQELLTQAKNMEDIITIESAISDTEQQIEYLSGTLNRYDAQVDYSTVHISLSEVYRLSNTEEPVQGFGSRFITALKSGWQNFVSDMEDLAISLAYSWMWVIVWIVIIVVVIRAIRRRKGSGRKFFRKKKDTVDDTAEENEG